MPVLEELYDISIELQKKHHDLLVNMEQIQAEIARELHDEGVAHSLATLIESKFKLEHTDLYLEIASVTKEINEVNLRINEERDIYYRTMAESAKFNMEAEERYLKRSDELFKRTLEERKGPETTDDGEDKPND